MALFANWEALFGGIFPIALIKIIRGKHSTLMSRIRAHKLRYIGVLISAAKLLIV